MFLLPATLLTALVGLALLFGPSLVARHLNRVLPAPGSPPGAEARALHATLMVADLHTDALLWRRSLTRRGGYGHVDVPRLAEGRVGLQGFTVVTRTPRGMNIEANTGDSDQITPLVMLQAWPPRTWTRLVERAIHQASRLHRAAERSGGRLTVVTSRAELDRHLERWSRGEESVAGILGIEGAHALEGDLANLDRLHGAGFRMLGLTHFFDNEVGGSAHGVVRGGLTDFGAAVLARAAELGILVDLAHASPALMRDVLARATHPVVVSHGGVRGTCDNTRNLTDAQVRDVAATGGVVGIGLWATAVCGETVADWARAVRYVADLVGVEHVALGSDWDGAVEAIVDASGTIHLTRALLDQGFGADDVRRILGENVVRVWRETLPR
jgi:microsomal dipeptidase-like Zn-dependent dipeptidase